MPAQTDDEFDAAVARMIADPEALKREIMTKTKRESPDMTDEQLEWSWRQLANQMGF